MSALNKIGSTILVLLISICVFSQTPRKKGNDPQEFDMERFGTLQTKPIKIGNNKSIRKNSGVDRFTSGDTIPTATINENDRKVDSSTKSYYLKERSYFEQLYNWYGEFYAGNLSMSGWRVSLRQNLPGQATEAGEPLPNSNPSGKDDNGNDLERDANLSIHYNASFNTISSKYLNLPDTAGVFEKIPYSQHFRRRGYMLQPLQKAPFNFYYPHFLSFIRLNRYFWVYGTGEIWR